jgi:pimeloyl-ACP methyl ester carboxylesterase
MTPPQVVKSKSAVSFLKTGMKREIPYKSKKLMAWSWGEGPMALLVHGWGGYGAQLRGFVEPLVSTGHQVVSFDAYGHGESDGRLSSVIHISDSIQAVLETLGNKPKTIVAHSMGTSALLLNMAQYKTPVESVNLISPPLEGPLAHSKKFARLVGINENQRREMQEQIEWKLDHPWEELEIPYLLESIKDKKTLLIHDLEDPMTPFTNTVKMASYLNDVTILETKGYGHYKILNHKKVIEKVVEQVR